MQIPWEDLIRTGLVLAILLAVTFAIVAALRLEKPWLQPWSIVRAIIQLGILTLILANIIHSVWLVAAFLVVMVSAGAWIVRSRLAMPLSRMPLIMAIIALSAIVPAGIVFLTGALAPEPRLILAFGGIIIGNAMTASTLMGRATAEQIDADKYIIEGWLALGATPRIAAAPSLRKAGSLAIMPATDQARVTGLVTLPGAFVGAVFAGASVLDAAQFQLVVLTGILCAGAISVACWTWVSGAPKTLPITE
ncbi:ABC transporter permease [Haematomicrobium sanguinis]|uniref:ABC transporter permease n=1 Tax=Haematomicrobium sanguinis TaxID=479106 RepID=UPI000552DDC5|nr:ABC transporter permease [Haematomicrobium sanguinis]